MKNKRRNHSTAFKEKVVLVAAEGDKTISELAGEYSVHPTLITKWKPQLLESMSDIFSLKLQKQQHAA